ncbi:helix-turn-helix domain-containing protein [Lactococcus termiticola]|uniref:XRE family transcriptional regulator n=1 Tax=Lactococcus termiticola TaxID=2169526 RepID=A0A2R5HKM6_9LACT|nr:helix-turn-helix transcriptional regulator [Lactococcus termiticola]GBG97460.1 XRE family transcriptional regulator [Lactococcus termiticola]
MDNIKSQAIGKRILNLREKLNMSQKSFAEALGDISQRLVGYWEKGERFPPLDQIVKIAKLGEVPVNWLLFGNDEENLQNWSYKKAFDSFQRLDKSDYFGVIVKVLPALENIIPRTEEDIYIPREPDRENHERNYDEENYHNFSVWSNATRAGLIIDIVSSLAEQIPDNENERLKLEQKISTYIHEYLEYSDRDFSDIPDSLRERYKSLED